MSEDRWNPYTRFSGRWGQNAIAMGGGQMFENCQTTLVIKELARDVTSCEKEPS